MDQERSVVVATHQEVDAVVSNEIDEAVLLSDPSRPDVGSEMLDGFWFADAREGVAHDGLDELEESESSAAVGLNPELQVFPEFVLEDREAGCRSGGSRLPTLGGQTRSSGRRWIGAW